MLGAAVAWIVARLAVGPAASREDLVRLGYLFEGGIIPALSDLLNHPLRSRRSNLDRGVAIFPGCLGGFMRRLNSAWLSALVAMSAWPPAPGNATPYPQQPRADVHALDRAISGKDRVLERIVADDFIWVRGSGETGGKADFIDALTRSDLSILPYQSSDTLLYSSETLELWTDTNVLRGKDAGLEFVDRHHFADLWEKRDGRWVLVYVQVTRVLSQPAD
ncbi:nuclear transport factor 2 family protein [Allosphingosinicella indica]|nr:nuclear transport factor 2 family protein [Allosphingosinicella indica]